MTSENIKEIFLKNILLNFTLNELTENLITKSCMINSTKILDFVSKNTYIGTEKYLFRENLEKPREYINKGVGYLKMNSDKIKEGKKIHLFSNSSFFRDNFSEEKNKNSKILKKSIEIEGKNKINFCDKEIYRIFRRNLNLHKNNFSDLKIYFEIIPSTINKKISSTKEINNFSKDFINLEKIKSNNFIFKTDKTYISRKKFYLSLDHNENKKHLAKKGQDYLKNLAFNLLNENKKKKNHLKLQMKNPHFSK